MKRTGMFFYRLEPARLLSKLITMPESERGSWITKVAIDLSNGNSEDDFAKSLIEEANLYSETKRKAVEQRWNKVKQMDTPEIHVNTPVSLCNTRSRSSNRSSNSNIQTSTSTDRGEKKSKSPQLAVALIDLPPFVLRDSWMGFIEMRQKIKKPPTERAAQMLVKKLINFHNRGFDVNEILDQSTVNSWQDLYEPKSQQRGNQRDPPKTFEQLKMERLKQNMVDFVGGDYDGPGQETVCLVDG